MSILYYSIIIPHIPSKRHYVATVSTLLHRRIHLDDPIQYIFSSASNCVLCVNCLAMFVWERVATPTRWLGGKLARFLPALRSWRRLTIIATMLVYGSVWFVWSIFSIMQTKLYYAAPSKRKQEGACSFFSSHPGRVLIKVQGTVHGHQRTAYVR